MMTSWRRLRLILAACWLGLCCACSAGGLEPQAAAGNNTDQATTGGLPAFPGDSPGRLWRQLSADSFNTAGVDFAVLSPGSASYAHPTDTGAYVLVPALGGAEAGARDAHYAWARYSLSAVTGDRPVSINLDLAAAPAAGQTANLPLKYYVGLANYTTYSWEWRGPYTTSATLPLNPWLDGGAVSHNDRYVSASGVFHVVVLVDSAGVSAAPPDNPLGLAAVAVRSLTLNTNPAYAFNKPHYPLLTAVYIGEAHGASGAKRSSAILPVQYINIEWQDVAPFSETDAPNAATHYLLWRKGPLDLQPVQVSDQVGPGFIDPASLPPNGALPVPGTTYRYYLQAMNDYGGTHVNATAPVTMPLLTPEHVQVTRDGADDGIGVSWDAVDGAQVYEIWRSESTDVQAAVQTATVNAPATDYLDTDARPGFEYWYFVRAVGVGDGDSANGVEPGSVSEFSATTISGVRKVVISVQCSTPGVSGLGSTFSPFQLSAGSTYTFTAHDQDSNDLTLFCFWSVNPFIAGVFGPLPQNQLHDLVAGAGAIELHARFAYQSFEWTGIGYANVP